MPTMATPYILTDPGYLFWAPLATAVPTFTVAGSKFTDAWPVAYIPLGATEDGSEFSFSSSVEPIRVAELFHPVQYATTEQAASIAFSLADYTANNLKRAWNGGTIATVSGTGATTLSKLTPPNPSQITRAMIGWESLDATVRLIAYQTINGAEITTAFKKAPEKALIPTKFSFEKPSATEPFDMWFAGTARVGA
jgi:hypothetical protein